SFDLHAPLPLAYYATTNLLPPDAQLPPGTTHQTSQYVDLIDMNGDGVLDYVISVGERTFKVYYGYRTGDGQFAFSPVANEMHPRPPQPFPPAAEFPLPLRRTIQADLMPPSATGSMPTQVVAALVDVDGNGLPDDVYQDAQGFHVALN